MTANVIDLDARRRAMQVPVLPDTSHETIQRYVVDKIIDQRGGLVHCEGQWWAPGPIGAWVALPDEVLWAEVQALNGIDTLEGAKDDKPGKAIRVSAGMCESVVSLARARCTDHEFFARALSGFVSPRGLWTCSPMAGWEVRPATPDDRVRLYIDVDPDMETTPALWVGALQRMWGHEADLPERQAMLHEWIGSVLLGTATRYQVAPILVGDGANGKSQILEVVCGLVPAALRCSVTPDDLETNRFASVFLVGKALNCVAEIPGNELLTSARIKAIIDGSEQSAEFKGKDMFKMRPHAGHIFSANTLPHVRDLSHGFWRRWTLFTCTAPKIDAGERRLDFAAEILMSERAAILGYAMRYHEAMVMERRGPTEVPSSAAAIARWRADSDSVQAWADECASKGGETAIRTLYEHYRTWAERSGVKAVAARTFGSRLEALGYPPVRSRDERLRELTIKVVPGGAA